MNDIEKQQQQQQQPTNASAQVSPLEVSSNKTEQSSIIINTIIIIVLIYLISVFISIFVRMIYAFQNTPAPELLDTYIKYGLIIEIVVIVFVIINKYFKCIKELL